MSQKKKTPMTPEAAKRIKQGAQKGKDSGFVDRAEKAANRNQRKKTHSALIPRSGWSIRTSFGKKGGGGGGRPHNGPSQNTGKPSGGGRGNNPPAPKK